MISHIKRKKLDVGGEEKEIIICSGKIHFDLGTGFSLHGHGMVNSQGMVITEITFEPLCDESDIEITYFCYDCNEEISEEELILECTHCFQGFPLKDLAVIEKMSGVYCEKGINQLKEDFPEDSKITSVSEIIKNVKILKS